MESQSVNITEISTTIGSLSTEPAIADDFVQRQSIRSLIAITCFAAAGILANILSAVAILHVQSLGPPLKLLLSLSLADILTDFAYIAQVLLSVLFPPSDHTFFVSGLLLASSLLCVFFNVIAITIDRFICIVLPLHYNAIVNKRRTTSGIVIIWILAFLCGTACGALLAFLKYKAGARIVNITLVTVVSVPILATCILYIKVALVIKNMRKRHDDQSCVKPVKTSKGAITATLILGSFLTCCIPPSVFIILLEARPDLFINIGVSIMELYSGFACLNLLNTVLDPCIYGFRNARVRQGFTRMVSKCRCPKKNNKASSRMDIQTTTSSAL